MLTHVWRDPGAGCYAAILMALDYSPPPRIHVTRSLALVLLLAACGPESAASTDGDTTTGSTGPTTTSPTTTAPTTGAGPPVVDCAEVPTELAAPQWTADLTDFPLGVAASLEGDAALLYYDSLERRGAAGVVWSQPPLADEHVQALAALPDGQIVLGGWVNEGDDAPAFLARLGADGERLATQPFDPDPARSEVVQALAVTSAGDVFTASMAFVAEQPDQPPRLRLDRFDAALAHVWGVDAGEYGFAPALAVDDDGDAYLATVDIAAVGDQGFEYTWSLVVRAFDPDGAPGWTSDAVEVVTDNNLVDVDVSVGDRVYALAGNKFGFVLRALSSAGEVAWTVGKDADEVGDHWLHAVVASPCGGAFVGGRSDVELDGVSERASLFHVAADGTFGPITYMLDEPFDGAYTFGEVTDLAISPLGRLVAVGTLRPKLVADDERRWLHGY